MNTLIINFKTMNNNRNINSKLEQPSSSSLLKPHLIELLNPPILSRTQTSQITNPYKAEQILEREKQRRIKFSESNKSAMNEAMHG